MWKLLGALVVALILVVWLRVVHQDDEVLALIRNDVVSDGTGHRSWMGRFVNTHDQALRDVAVAVEFIDQQGRRVGSTSALASELTYGSYLDLQAPLPDSAVKIRILSVQWRMNEKAVLMGPFREPWDFGYLMVDPARTGR